jgi:hypothetical protein
MKYQHSKAGWSVTDWCNDAGFGRSKAYEEMKTGAIKYVKVGARTIITTKPADYLASRQTEAA